MASQEEIKDIRLSKIELLKKAGMNPYPPKVPRDFCLKDARANFKEYEKSQKVVSVAGRIMAIRGQGAILFVVLDDGKSTLQAVVKKDTLAPELFELFSQAVDIGDILSVTGTFFTTNRGEESLLVTSWTMAAKSLFALPEKWSGIQDIEERFRKRYLDILMSKGVRERFILRSKIVTSLRSILDRAEYLEVETPQLQPLAGGTNALPFLTHHNALDIDLYLRIAPELYLKKLLIAGFPRVYEIGRNFRNEGIDTTHNPEFTMLEFYAAYTDSLKQMDFTEKMIRELVVNVLGKSVIEVGEMQIDFSKPFTRITYKDLVKNTAGFDPLSATKKEVEACAEKIDLKIEKSDSREKIIDNIYKKIARPKLIQPTFVTDYPIDMIPLAKRSEKNPSVADVFQLVAGGMELVKAFSELNDPVEQHARFTKEEKNAQEGDKEAQPNDEEFVEALGYGMPPAGGVGVGIDRLVMLLTNMRNIKEVILFPTMRPK